MNAIQQITVEVGDKTITVHGRVAWALNNLLTAGAAGCTPLTHVGPRWSDYIFKLRKAGLDVETITESHPPPYSGHHARYVLRSTVSVISSAEAA